MCLWVLNEKTRIVILNNMKDRFWLTICMFLTKTLLYSLLSFISDTFDA